jgi:hypothetical protein
MSGQHGYDGLDDLFEAAGEHQAEHRALILLGVVGLALALILGAFFVGRGVADSVRTAARTAAPGDAAAGDSLADAALGGQSTTAGSSSSRPSESPSRTDPQAPATSPAGRLVGEPYRGSVVPAGVAGAGASCRAEPSVDSGGNRVTYPATNMLDAADATAWRCEGNGRGVTLTFRLGARQRIAEVGLVPGYAKTDPFSGADRYAENRRIARVRWSFSGGEWVEQRFDTDAETRRMQTLRIPPVATCRVTVSIEQTSQARRNTVAVSGVRLARPRP